MYRYACAYMHYNEMKIIQQQVLDKYEKEMHQPKEELIEKERRIETLIQKLDEATASLQQSQKDKEEQNEQLHELKSSQYNNIDYFNNYLYLEKEAVTVELHEASTQHQLSIEFFTKQVEKLQEELKNERQLSSSLIKQKKRTTDARDKDNKDHKEVGVQFDYLIPQSGMCVCVYWQQI